MNAHMIRVGNEGEKPLLYCDRCHKRVAAASGAVMAYMVADVAEVAEWADAEQVPILSGSLFVLHDECVGSWREIYRGLTMGREPWRTVPLSSGLHVLCSLLGLAPGR